MENSFDFVGLGFCSNDYLCILPYIPLDNKVKIIKRIIQGGGPAGNSTVAASKLGLKAAFVSAIGDDADGKKMIEDFEAEKVCTKGIKSARAANPRLHTAGLTSPRARAVSLGPAAIRPSLNPTRLICRFWTALKFYISTGTTQKAPSPL